MDLINLHLPSAYTTVDVFLNYLVSCAITRSVLKLKNDHHNWRKIRSDAQGSVIDFHKNQTALSGAQASPSHGNKK